MSNTYLIYVLENIVNRIHKNANSNIESIIADLEDLEISASNRKRKRPKVEPTSVKKRNVKRRLFKETPAAKEFIQDEAEVSGKNLLSVYYPLLSVIIRLFIRLLSFVMRVAIADSLFRFGRRAKRERPIKRDGRDRFNYKWRHR